MSFDDVRLPTTVEKGASGGPAFRTTILTLSSGREQRNQHWSQSRGRWDIGYGIQGRADLAVVLAFFYARRGRARGFRFRDWSDYRRDEKVRFATGNGSARVFELSVPYTSGGETYTRPITRPVVDTVELYVGGRSVTGSVDGATGQVTLGSAPASGAALEWTGEWDVPVRFDSDSLEIAMEIFDAGTIPQIPIVELRA